MRGMYDIEELGEDNEAFLILTAKGKKEFYKKQKEKEYTNDTVRNDRTDKGSV